MKNKVKRQVKANKNQEIMLVCDEGRNVIRKERAIIREIYHSLFVVDVYKDNKEMQRESYSYADLITEVVQLFNPQETAQLITV